MKRLVRASFLSATLAVFAVHASLASAQTTPPADAWPHRTLQKPECADRSRQGQTHEHPLRHLRLGLRPASGGRAAGAEAAGIQLQDAPYRGSSQSAIALMGGEIQLGIDTVVGQLRFVVGTDWQNVQATLREHLDAHGFSQVEIAMGMHCGATRLDLHNPWVDWTMASLQASAGQPATLLPNLAGSLPNDIFADQLGLPTLWVPHSYPACAQHAPNEHLLAPVAREGLAVMAGLFWDLGEPQGTPWTEGRTARHEATA